jgi:hypothetical protein
MRELVDTLAARASGVAPDKAWAMLDLARAARYTGARLTWCAGWTSVLRDDPAKPLTAAGKPGRSAVDVVTQSLVLRVPGLLWCAWERPDGAAVWVPPSAKMQGQIRTSDPGGARVATCTVAAAEKALRAAIKTRGTTNR